MSLKRSFIHKLPKTDLHLHLDGSLRMSTIFDLAKKQNVELPAKTEEELKKMIACTDTCASLEQYLKAFDITLSVMQTEEALYRVAFELAEDCAAENIR
ncbi:MAG TPA: adenosine deaminase, partial [Candidatus Cloacimonadota bacterium]|nr:adenosine deaminase [Candidatus Cloacimonadota bacterium]